MYVNNRLSQFVETINQGSDQFKRRKIFNERQFSRL